MLEEYLNQDIDNPKYLFHGSPKKLDVLVPQESHDSRGNSNNLATAVNSVTTKSNEMKDALVKEGGIIDTLGTELDAVNDVTAAYEKQRDMIQEVIDKMLEKAKLI